MKKKDSAGLGMKIPKKIRIAGITFYLRNGQVVGRESSTHEKRSNTLPQFITKELRKDEATPALEVLDDFHCQVIISVPY